MACHHLRRCNITAELYFFAYAVGFLSLSSFIPQFLLHQSCSRKFNSTICSSLDEFAVEQEAVQEDAAFWLSMAYLGRFLPGCFTLMVFGSVVDYVGPHRGMLFPPAIMTIQSVLYMATAFYTSSSSGFVVAIASLSSLHGDLAGLFVVTSSYIAAITKPKERSKRLTIVQGGALFGDVIAGLTGGIVLQEFGFSVSFASLAALGLVIVLVAYCAAKPVTRSYDKTEQPSIGEIFNPLHHFKAAYQITLKTKYKYNFVLLMGGIFSSFLAVRGEFYMSVMYMTNAPFNLGPAQVGYLLAYIACMRGLGSVVVAQILRKCCRASDFVVFVFSLVLGAVYLTLIGLSKSTLMLYIVHALGSVLYLALPVFRGNVTKLVANENSGKASGLVESGGMACSVIVGFGAPNVYRSTLAIDPGLVFFVLASCLGVSLVFVVIKQCLLRNGTLLRPSKEAADVVMLPKYDVAIRESL